MNIHINFHKFTLHEDAREYIGYKIDSIPNAENMIMDILITLKKENYFEADATISFHWGVTSQVKANENGIYELIDILIDKINAKIINERKNLEEKRKGLSVHK